MANLEIAQIQNAALKAAALEVDESGKKDGYIDSSEINAFADKARVLLKAYTFVAGTGKDFEKKHIDYIIQNFLKTRVRYRL